LRLVAVGLVLTLLGGSVVPQKLLAQDASSRTGQRKIRSKVEPAIPELAKQMHLTGNVKIEATIAADGHVLDTRVIGGSPVLVNAALQALMKWRFEPAPTITTAVIEFRFESD
jgi:TonB family protein